MRQTRLFFVAVVTILLSACSSHYKVVDVQRVRLLIDSRYDATPDQTAAEFLQPYKHVVDSLMGPVVGRTSSYMAAYRPESELSNLLADVLVSAGERYNEKPDFGVYNIGGMRASLAEGDVTIGDITEVAPFENKICFMTLTGSKVLELFQQIAGRGGEGVSGSVRIVMTKDRKLVSAKINGKDIDPDAKYRVATLDYLAEGNDEMVAFKSGTDLNSPKEESNNVRYIIMDYFRTKAAANEVVVGKKEGRITVK